MTHRSAPIDPCPSDFFLDRLDGGDATSEVRLRFERHCAGCSECASRLEQRRRVRRHFELEFPTRAPFVLAGTTSNPTALHPSSGSASRSSWTRWPRVGVWLLPAAAAAALLVSLRQPHTDSLGVSGTHRGNAKLGDEAETLRTKGGLRLGFFVRRGVSVFQGGYGESVRPGDALQFSVAAPHAGYLAVLSRDGAGRASIYYPEGRQAARVEAGEQILPLSTLLDGVLGQERLLAVLCAEPFETETLRRRLEEDPRAPLASPGCTVDSVVIDKVSQ